MEKDYRIRGDVVRYHRIKKRMSQQVLAGKADLSLGQISRIEGGHIDAPRFSTIEKLAEALGLTEDDLIEWLMLVPA